MPQVDLEENVVLGERPESSVVEAPGINRLGFTDVIGDAFSIDNTIGSFLSSEDISESLTDLQSSADRGELDPDFNPFTKGQTMGYEGDDLEALMWAANQEQFNLIEKQLLGEQHSRKRLEDSGVDGVLASITAGIFDPINLIPIGGSAVRVGKTGARIVKGATTTALTSIPSLVASEAVLGETQLTRTIEEQALNISGGIVLSGILGAGVSALTRSQVDTGGKLIEDWMNDDIPLVPTGHEVEINNLRARMTDSVGAAAVIKTTNEQEELLSNTVFKAGAMSIGKLSPSTRSSMNSMKSVKNISERLMESNLFRVKDTEGIASAASAETKKKLFDRPLAESVMAKRDAYKEYKKTGKVAGEPLLPSREWDEAVGKAMRRGDNADGLKIPNSAKASVTKAAQATRNHFDHMKQKAIDVGILDADVDAKTAESWFHRIYNTTTIESRRGEFKTKITPYLKKQINERIAAMERLIKAKAGTQAAKDTELDLRTVLKREDMDAYLDEVADQIVAKITGKDQFLEFNEIKPIARGPLKERTLLVPDEVIEDFLISDVSLIEEKINRVMGGEIVLKEEFGTTRFADVKEEIDLEFKETAATLKDGSPELARLTKDHKRGIEDLSIVWDLIRGTYRSSTASPDSIVRRGLGTARTLNYLRLLGGVLKSSIPDVFMPVFTNGAARVFGDVYAPLIKSFTDPSAANFIKLSKQEARLAGIGYESVLNTRIRANYGVGDPFVKGTAMERFLDNNGRDFGKWTGLNKWNDFGKDVAAITTQQRILDGAVAGKLSKKETTRLSNLGFGEVELKNVANEFKKHGKVIDGKKIANTEEWDSQRLAERFRAALKKSADTTIITKGAGDVPLVVNGEAMKTILQFQSFNFAATQKILLSGMQRQDAEVLQGMMGMITMGMFVYALKAIESGKELSDDPLVWITEGVDRSGMAAMPFLLNDSLLEPAGLGLSNLVGEPLPKFTRYNSAARLAGPTAGLISDIFVGAGGITDALLRGENVSDSAIESGRRVIPYNNLIGISHLFDAVEDGLKNK